MCLQKARHGKKAPVLFAFPKEKKGRVQTNVVNRNKQTSDHFVDGRKRGDPSDVNFAPTMFAYKQKRTEYKNEKQPGYL